MCLLFAYLNDGTDHRIGYKVVLINNRDEYWERPTDTANFRGEDDWWIGGIDLAPGREGGSWLGINKLGQVAVLLNILAHHKKSQKGRGNLVTDFVANTSVSCEEYLQNVALDKNNYNPFKLILIDLRKQPQCFHYLNSLENGKRSWHTLHNGTIAFGNSVDTYNKPWNKTQIGKAKFLDILQKYGDAHSKGALIEKCIAMLNDRTQTNTIILVDNENNCDYVERTLETPVNVEQPKWTTVRYRFKLEMTSRM